tara:strand:+ start:16242 stop:16586 length:345 start_codon:yes stop_codon:yes gene_type:complete
MLFSNTISALVITLVRENTGLEGVYNGQLGHAESFVINQLKRMPDYILVVLQLLLFIFNIIVIIKTGKRFSKLHPSKRLRMIQNLRGSLFGFMRDLVKVFDSLVLFSLTETEAI